MLSTVSKCQSLLVVVLAWFLHCATTASAQVLFSEDFEDAMLTMNAMVNEHVTVENGIAKFNDPPTEDPTPDRATFAVVQDFTDPVMTFSFDVVEPVVAQPPGTRMEMLFRAGIGTANNTLQSGDQIVEAIMFRGVDAAGNRGAYTNNGNETIFLVANNNANPLTFESPVDGSDVMLTGFQYIPYVRNNETGMFGEVKGITPFTAAHQPVFGTFNRFGIGSSTNADVGTFAIDNVLVVSGVSFEQVDPGPMCILGDVDCNNVVEFVDFEPIRANFRKPVGTRAEGDLVGNGIVDFADFHEWKAAFLGAGGSLAGVDLGFLASVPEPGTVVLLLWGWAAITGSSRAARGRSAP
jgi:hypothetical protein